MAIPVPRVWAPGDLADQTLLNTNIRDMVLFQRARPMTFLTRSASLSITSGQWTGVTWASGELRDSEDGFGAATEYKWVTARVAGVYDVRVQAFWAPNTSGDRAVRIRNHWAGTTICQSGVASSGSAPDGTDWTGQNVDTIVECNRYHAMSVGDAVMIEVYQNSGGSLNLVCGYNASMQLMTYFSVRWVATL